MNDIVNQISITSVIASVLESNQFSVTLTWSLNGGYSCEYKGDYNITLYENSINKNTKTFTDTLGSQSTTVSFADLTLGKRYQIKVAVPEAQGGVSSEKTTVIIDYCTDIHGTFNGEIFEIYWKSTTTKIPNTQCIMTCSNGVSNAYYPCTTAGYLKFKSIDFSPDGTIDVKLALTDKNKSVGPVSSALKFYAAPISILSMAVSDLTDSSKLTLILKSPYDSISKVNIYFKSAQHIIARISNVAVNKQANGDYLIDTAVPHSTISFDALFACSVYCTALQDSAESHVYGFAGIMPIASPQIQIDAITKDIINMSVCSEYTEYPPIGYELPDGTMLCSSTYSVPFNKTFSLMLRPRYDIGGLVRKGCVSNTVSAFRSGYYPTKSSDNDKKTYLKLYQASFTEQFINHSFKFELFKTRLTENVEKGSLKLEVLENEYKLIVNTSSPLILKDYSDFLDAIKDNIKPYGFYCLCDSILRLSTHYVSDTLNLLCAFKPKERTADLRPGVILNLSTSVYQPQYDPQIPNTAGYSAMYNNSYPVSICSDGTYLQFDRYSAAISENMSIASTPNKATNIIFASSILDMLQPAVKQPYYRLLYPNQISHDYSTETPYPSDNMVILCADSYSALLTACDSIKANPSAINNLSIPIVIFKGRSTLSIHIPVILNNQRITVPVGSTINDVLQQYGMYSSHNFKLYRRCSDGSELPVFIQFADKPQDIVLINGDRITG